MIPTCPSGLAVATRATFVAGDPDADPVGSRTLRASLDPVLATAKPDRIPVVRYGILRPASESTVCSMR